MASIIMFFFQRGIYANLQQSTADNDWEFRTKGGRIRVHWECSDFDRSRTAAEFFRNDPGIEP